MIQKDTRFLKNVSQKHSVHLNIMDSIAEIGFSLQSTIRDLIEPVAGLRPKPNDIGEVLKLDRTQAWRVSRIISDECPYTIVYESPAAKGLGLIIDAAVRAGASKQHAKAAREVVRKYDEMVDQFPEGRTGLESALGAYVPKAKEAANKKARKQVSIGMSQLLGLRASVRYVSGLLVPSDAIESKADVVAVAGYTDLRRLHIGPSPAIFSGRTYTHTPAHLDPAVETLDGDQDPDPRLRLLSQYGSVPQDALTLVTSGNELRLVLAPDYPAINDPITVFFGQRIARSLERHRTEDRTHEIVHHAPVLPANMNIFDTIIHKDLYPNAHPPKLTIERFGFNPVTQSQKPDDDSYRTNESPEVIKLGTGINKIGVRQIPQLKEMLESVFERIDQDPNDFVVYRTMIEFLPPGFAVTVWIPLDEKSDD